VSVSEGSNSGAGGLWQNPAYPVINSTSLFVPNQTVGNFAGVGFQPTAQPGVPSLALGGVGPQSTLQVVQVSAFSAYEISFNFSVGSPLVTGQIMQVDIYWWDQLGDSVPVEHIRWESPVSAVNGLANGFNTWGHGPMAGQWMAVTVQNQTATGFPNGVMSFTGTTRNWANHDWRSDGGISSLTGSGATPYSNELCTVNAANVPASSTAQRQIYLYSGQAMFHTGNAAAAGTLTMAIQDSSGREIISLHPAINGTADELIELPRKLCQLIISNSSGTAAGTANVAIIADRP
jgi:hypothetical protein